MQISSNYNSPQRSNQTFTSHFVRSRLLRDTFSGFHFTEDLSEMRQYANAVEGLLKDGKKDSLKFVDRGRYIRLDVNNKEYSRFDALSLSRDEKRAKIRNSIIDFAEKERGIKRVFGYDNLSEREIASVKDLNVAKRMQGLNPENKKHANIIERLKEIVKEKLYFETEWRLDNLNSEIGKPQKTQTIGKGTEENVLKNLLG